MKNLKKVLALVLAFACAFTMFAGAAFTDQADIKVENEVVDTLIELGVINGYTDGSFKPNDTVTRAEMAKMIYVLRTGNSDASAYNNDKTTFTDINGHWAAGYIKYCQSVGIIAGKSATVFAPEKQESTCDFCGEKTTKTVGKKLTPTVKLTATKLALKTKQSVTVRATGLAKGDYVKSWTSSKKSVATVDKNGKITATSKEGTAVITVTLASKKTAKVTVTVKMIRTTKLTKVPKTLSLTTGKKYTLKPVVTPSNSQEKVTYKSSNTKIATVSSTGVITAKKAGTAVITVKSGSKKVTCKVTVK